MIARVTRILALIGVLALIGGLAPRISATQHFDEDERCQWLAGDLHIHTTYSHDSYGGPGDDNTGPDEAYIAGHTTEGQFAVAKSRDLDFLAITDHNDVRSQEHFDDATISGSGIIPIGGYENSLDGHAQMLGADHLYDAGNKSADAVNAMAAALRADGGVFQINHPFDSADTEHEPSWEYGFQVQPDTIEVWNIPRVYQPPLPSATHNDEGIRYWEKWLDDGVKVGATGGSDNHWVSTTAVQGAGQPTTWVCSSSRTEEGLLDGLKKGRTFISHQPPGLDGPQIFLEADPGGDGDFESMVGDEVPSGSPLRVRVTGAPGSLLRIVTTEGRVFDEDIPVTTPSFAHNFTLPQGERWVRAEIYEPDAEDQREEFKDDCEVPDNPIGGGQSTYCENKLLVLAMTSAIYIGEPLPPRDRLTGGQFLVGADKTSLAPTPDEYQPNGDSRTDPSQPAANWEKDPLKCNLVRTTDGGDPEFDEGDIERLSEAHAFPFPDSTLGWPGHNPDCIYLGGYGIGPLRGAEGVDDRGVWVRSVAVSNGEKAVIFQVIDTVGYFYRYRDDICDGCGLADIRKSISNKLLLGGPEYVSVASTHTHGGADGYGGWGGVPKWYYHQMRDAIIDSAIEAYEAMEQATIDVGAVEARQFNNERRDHYFSTPDYGAVWMQARDSSNSPIATFVNYAAHPVTTDWDNKNLHADWLGVLNAELEGLFGGTALTIEGGLGNVSPSGGQDNMGGNFARYIKKDVERGASRLESNLIAASEVVIEHPITNAEEYGLGAIGAFDREFLPGTQGATGPTRYQWSKQQNNPGLARSCVSASPTGIRTPVTGYRIGGLNVFTGPGELFSNLTEVVKSKANSGTQTMILGNTNDALGYIMQSFEFDSLTHAGSLAADSAGVAEYEEVFALDRCFGDHVLDEILKLNQDLPVAPAPLDSDNDGIPDSRDNCPNTTNADQRDSDGDGVGDACEDSTSPSPSMTASESPSPSESPSESVSPSESPSTSESASGSPSPSESAPPPDRDGDEIPDDVDNCPDTPNPGQANADGDTFGDACEPDFDDDGVADDTDNCRTVDNPAQVDRDRDGTGDACEGDTDGDGVIDDDDNCISEPNPTQENTYGDERGNACEPAPEPGGGGTGGGGGGTSPSPTPTSDNSGAAEESGEIQTTISADSSIIRFGDSLTLSGTIAAPRMCGSSFSVDLSRREFGSTTVETIATLEVGEDLVWTYTGLPKANASYLATARDSGPCEGQSSAPVDVLVKVKITALVPATCDRQATIRGAVAPSRPGTSVVLQRKIDGEWAKVDTDNLNNRSRYLLETGSCRGRFRVVWKGPDIRNERSALNFRLNN